jgi:hypothetical protein
MVEDQVGLVDVLISFGRDTVLNWMTLDQTCLIIALENGHFGLKSARASRAHLIWRGEIYFWGEPVRFRPSVSLSSPQRDIPPASLSAPSFFPLWTFSPSVPPATLVVFAFFGVGS